MASAMVTSKGQVTIPVEVRSKLGLRAGSRLTFVPTDRGGYEILVHDTSVRDLKGAITPPTVAVTLADMNEAVGAEASRT